MICTALIPCAIMVFTNTRVVLVMRKNKRVKRSDKSFGIVNFAMTSLFLLYVVTTATYNSITFTSTEPEDVIEVKSRPVTVVFYVMSRQSCVKVHFLRNWLNFNLHRRT